MSQVEQLLKYQEEDAKLLQIEREVANSEERKNYSIAKNFLTKAPEKLEALDAKAKELGALAKELEAKYKEIADTLSDFDNMDEIIDGGSTISYYKKNVLQISERIKGLKSEISALTKSVKDADEEYQAMKKKTIAVQKQYEEYRKTYSEYKDRKVAEMKTVQADLDKLAKNIDAEVMKSYQIKRSERIFPILCQVSNGRCSKCGTELSLIGKEKISSGNVTECDNCHRFLYKG